MRLRRRALDRRRARAARAALSKDGRDECDVGDSTPLQTRRQQLLEQVDARCDARDVPPRVRKAMLRSSMVLSLADLLHVLTHSDMVDVLSQLVQVLKGRQDELFADGSPAQHEKRMAPLVAALPVCASPSSEERPYLHRRVEERVLPSTPDREWAFVASSATAYSSALGLKRRCTWSTPPCGI